MVLSLVTAPTAEEPLTLTAAKLHLRVSTDDEDSLITSLIVAARETFETRTGRKVSSQTWDLKLDAFPCNEIELPFPPVTSVTSVTYTDANGISQTWSSTLYTTSLPAGPQAGLACLYPIYGEIFPATRWVKNAVTVRFVCGYGTTNNPLPDAVLAGMKLLIGHWFENREAVIVGSTVEELPMAVDALWWPYWMKGQAAAA